MQLATFQLKVGQRLGVVPVSGSLSAEDGAVILAAYDLLVLELTANGLAYWSSDEAVPDEYGDILVSMTAANLVDDFTLPEPRRTVLVAEGKWGLPQPSVAERRLRRLTTLSADETQDCAEFY